MASRVPADVARSGWGDAFLLRCAVVDERRGVKRELGGQRGQLDRVVPLFLRAFSAWEEWMSPHAKPSRTPAVPVVDGRAG